jgi:hypothetical protein
VNDGRENEVTNKWSCVVHEAYIVLLYIEPKPILDAVELCNQGKSVPHRPLRNESQLSA